MHSFFEIRNLIVHRGGRPVLEVDQLAVNEAEVLAIIGPNGAGKSTLLLAMAQLLTPQQGEFFFRGQRLEPGAGLAFRRRIALVLQDPLLLDASVYDNVAAGLRFRRVKRKAIDRRVEDWLGQLGVLHLRDRPVRQLSGGEAQRVSLARAFALDPELLLLDEPFSALDTPTRSRLLEDFHALLATTSMTTVFITHDLDEALLLGDRVAVILDGRIRQIAPPDLVFSAPRDPEVASFVGVETVVAGQVVAGENGLVVVDASGIQLQAVGQVALGRTVMLCLRPEDVTLWAGEQVPASSARNRLIGAIVRVTPHGPLVRVVVDCGFQVVALVTRASANQMGLGLGQQVTATFKASAVHLIPR